MCERPKSVKGRTKTQQLENEGLKIWPSRITFPKQERFSKIQLKTVS